MGLDSTQTDGVNAIASLEEITGILSKNGKRDNHDSPGAFTAYPGIHNTNWCLGWRGLGQIKGEGEDERQWGVR